MLNPIKMIADLVAEINEFKKNNLDALLETYNEKMSKVAELERQISDIPNKYAGKSKTFISNKRKQLTDRVERLKDSIDKWYESERKRALDRISGMIADVTGSINGSAKEESEMSSGIDNLTDSITS